MSSLERWLASLHSISCTYNLWLNLLDLWTVKQSGAGEVGAVVPCICKVDHWGADLVQEGKGNDLVSQSEQEGNESGSFFQGRGLGIVYTYIDIGV